MTWTHAIELRAFEVRGWLYPDEISLVYRTDCNRRCAMLARRVEIERNRTLAVWHVCVRGAIDEQNDRRTWSLDELVYGNPRAMHELVELRVELDRQGAEISRLRGALSHAEDWARTIASDERVVGWVHYHDYSLYLLLADCPVEFGVLHGPPPHATDEAERDAVASTPTEET